MKNKRRLIRFMRAFKGLNLNDKIKSMMTAMVSEELNRSNPPPEVLSTAIVLMNKKKDEKKE